MMTARPGYTIVAGCYCYKFKLLTVGSSSKNTTGSPSVEIPATLLTGG